MKTLKFRCWDKQRNLMRLVQRLSFGQDGSGDTILVDFLDEEGFDYGLVNGESGFLMQFTGLIDKNGKEIYEMDILKVDWSGVENEEYIVVNKYNKPFVMEWMGYEYPPFSRYLPMPKDIEIIGNVYENPELAGKVIVK
jgi:uncharacterized phage protein (TIGR01671 family)